MNFKDTIKQIKSSDELSIKDAEPILNLSYRQILRYIHHEDHDKKLKAKKKPVSIGRKEWRIKGKDLIDFLNKIEY